MLALFAAHQAAAGASGLAGGLVPAISASTLDGFAVGMLLSGGVFLLITAHAQGSRRFGRTVAPRPVSELASEPGRRSPGRCLSRHRPAPGRAGRHADAGEHLGCRPPAACLRPPGRDPGAGRPGRGVRVRC